MIIIKHGPQSVAQKSRLLCDVVVPEIVLCWQNVAHHRDGGHVDAHGQHLTVVAEVPGPAGDVHHEHAVVELCAL